MAEKHDGSIRIDTSLDNKGFEKGSEELIKAINSLTKEIEKLGELLSGDTVNIGEVADESGGKVDTLTEKIEGATEAAGALGDKLDEISQKDPTKAVEGSGGASGELGDAADALGDVADAAETASGATGNLGPELAEAGAGAEAAGAGLSKIGDPKLKIALLALGAATLAFTKGMERAKEKWADFTDEIHSGADTFNNLPTKFDKTKEHIGFLVAAMKHPKKAMEKLSYQASLLGKQLLASVGSRVLRSFKNVGLSAKAAAKNLAQMARQSVINGLRKLVVSIGALSTKMAVLGGSAIKAALSKAVSTISSLMSKAVSMAEEGIEGLVQKNAALNKSISGFMTACNQLKGSLAAAFAPILTVALPLLTKLIQYVTQAVNAFGMLMAALTGQKTFSKAVAVQADYAKSVDKSTKSTKKQGKATEELKRQLMGFDDVNILQRDKDDDTDDATGGYDPSAYGFDFEEVPIESGISDLAERIKAAWEKADFYSLGHDLGVKLKEGFDSIPWAKIQKYAARTGKSLATFLNGLQEVPGLASSAGTAIGELANTWFHFLDGFGANYNWSTLGQFIREGVLAAITTIDWELIYKVAKEFGSGIGRAIEAALDDPQLWAELFTSLSNNVNATIYFLTSLLEAIDWGSIFANISNGLNTGIQSIDWVALSQAFVNIFNGIFDAAYNFITNFDWAAFGTALGQFLQNVIEGVNIEELFVSIGLLINNIFQTMLSFLQQVDWAQMALDFTNGLNAGINAVDPETISEAISTLINSLIAMFFRFVIEFNWLEFGMTIGQTIGDTLEQTDWNQFADSIALFINGLFTALKGFIAAIDWTQLVLDIVYFMLELFEAMDWEEYGETLNLFITSLLTALEYVVYNTDWDSVIKMVTDSFDDFFQQFDWEDLVRRAINLFFAAWKIYHDAKNAVWGVIREVGKQAILGLLKGMVDNLANIKEWLRENIFKKIFAGIAAVFGIHSPAKEMTPLGENITSGLLEGVKSPMSSIKDWLSNHVKGPFLSKLRSIFGTKSSASAMAKEGKELTEDLKDGADKGWSSVNKVFQTGLKNVVNLVKQTNWKSLGNYMTSQIASGMNWNAVISAARNGAQSAYNAFQSSGNWYYLGQMAAAGIADGLYAGGGNVAYTARVVAIDAYNAACAELGVASPSKKFIWIAEMMMEGMRRGLLASESGALKVISSIASNIVDTAESESPLMDLKIESSIDSLDNVLTSFSDKIVNGFTEMMAQLETVANGTGFFFPAVAQGTLAPYATSTATPASMAMETSNTDVVDAISRLESAMLRQEDLRPLLEDIARRYQPTFFMGDEQVARHANAGNELLAQRYNNR